MENGELSFLETGDAELPISLILEVAEADKSKKRSLVDKYAAHGANPKIKSLFFYPVQGKQNVLVLVSWDQTDHGTAVHYGIYYKVYGYEKGSSNKLTTNKLIEFDEHLSSFEGFVEGEEEHFTYENEESIIFYIKNSINVP